jgi:transmembrane sensor
MDDLQIKQLIQKYLEDQTTVEETALLESWYLKQSTAFQRPDAEMIDRNESMMLNFLESRIAEKKTISLWPRIAIAAAIAFIVIGAYFFRSNFNGTVNDNTKLAAADIAPGKNGATLTLANGQKIFINGELAGNIASQSGVKISKTKDGQLIYELTNQKGDKTEYNTLTTTRGEQIQVRLPDGSLVFLNAASSLKYPSSFVSLKERRVDLQGEAYFEVAKDKRHPFIVKAAQQEVKVLGTHFNINSYADEPEIKTTLLEGSVNVSNLNGKISEILKPGQQATVKGGNIKVGDADIDQAMSWKNGDFVFVGEDLKVVMRQVARWYDVEIEYQGNINSSGVVSTISRTKKLSQLLKALQKNQGIHFKVEGRRVLVMP